MFAEMYTAPRHTSGRSVINAKLLDLRDENCIKKYDKK